MIYKTLLNQSNADICVQLYGSLDYFEKLLNDNKKVLSLLEQPTIGTLVNYDNTIGNPLNVNVVNGYKLS